MGQTRVNYSGVNYPHVNKDIIAVLQPGKPAVQEDKKTFTANVFVHHKPKAEFVAVVLTGGTVFKGK